MKPITYSALKFAQGMTPKVFTPDSATRIEHFDTITEVLRPFRTLTVGTHLGSAADLVTIDLRKFAFLNDTVYALGLDLANTTFGAVYEYDPANSYWGGKITFGAVGNTALPSFIAHAGAFYGIIFSAPSYRIWKLTTGGTYTVSLYDTGATSYTSVADPIVHSKDGKAYFPLSNVIYTLDSTGASGAVGLTLPNTNFQITSICEQGNYINIVGVDTKTLKSSSLLWDRDSSVIDLTESYDLGSDVVVLNGNILGTTFFVQLRKNSTPTTWAEQPVLVIKWLNGAVPTTLYEFPLASCILASNAIGAKYISTDRIYFSAIVKFIGETTARNVVFCLDEKGRLTIAQNASADTNTTNLQTGLIRVGEGFWTAKGNASVGITLNPISTYTTISSYETNDIRSEDLSQNLDFVGGTVTCEPMIAGAQILVKMRKNEETTFTTVETLSETNRAKFSVTAMKVKNALVGLDSARQVRIRLESNGGAVITGAQFIFNPVADKTL